MTTNDLIAVTPWITFAVILAAICVQLIRSRHAARQEPKRSSARSPDLADSDGAAPGRCGRGDGDAPAAPWPAPADPEDDRPYAQEAPCPKKNT
jgi:hypothetical protein